MRLLAGLMLFPLAFDVCAQLKTPQTPASKNFLLTNINPYYRNSDLQSVDHRQSDERSYPMGTHASDIILQQNAQAMQQMGYKPPVVPPRDPSKYLRLDWDDAKGAHINWNRGKEKGAILFDQSVQNVELMINKLTSKIGQTEPLR